MLSSFTWLIRFHESANGRGLIQTETHLKVMSECCGLEITETTQDSRCHWVCTGCHSGLGQIESACNVALVGLRDAPPTDSQWKNWMKNCFGLDDVEVKIEW